MQIRTLGSPGPSAVGVAALAVAAVYLVGYVVLLATSTRVVGYFLER